MTTCLLLVMSVHAGPRRRPTDEPPPPPVEVSDPVPESEPALSQPPPLPPAPALFTQQRPIDVGPLPAGLANLSAQACAACHVTAHQTWHGGAHAESWQDPLFFDAVVATGSAPLCLGCHLPLAQQQPLQLQEYLGGELTRAQVRDNPSWDATLQQEGVTCAACHVREGTVLGTSPAPHAPHPVVVSDELSTSAFCGTCHQLAWPGADQPFYDTHDEWERSPYATAGVRCQDCHMAPVMGVATAGRFVGQADHGVALDPARAVSVLIQLPAGSATRGETLTGTVRIQNTGAGHAFPTGSPFVHVVVTATLLDAAGKPVGDPLTHRLQREVTPQAPYNTVSDTRLAAGGEVLLEHTLELGQKAAAGLGTYVVTLARVGSDGTVDPAFVTQSVPMWLD